jgi:3-dehydroquinate synthase
MSAESTERIAEHFDAAGMRAQVAQLGLNCDGQTLVGHMLHDKKMDAGTLPFLLMKGIGQTYLDREVDLGDVAAFLDGELA